MNDTVRNLVVSISVLALSGVTYLAFSEPLIYAVVYYVLSTLFIIAYAVVFVWAVALNRAGGAILRDGMADKGPFDDGTSKGRRLALASVESLELPFGWLTLILVVLLIYLSSLRVIPTLREALEKPAAPHAQSNLQTH